MIKIAAAGDVHFDRNSKGRLSKSLSRLADEADMLLLAGDLTQHGHVEEAAILAEDLSQSPVPVIAVLGNHDYHLNQEQAITETLMSAGVHILDRTSVVIPVGRGGPLNQCTVGIIGLKGFGGGFLGACGSEFGESEMKAFIRHTKEQARLLRQGLEQIDADYRIVLLHYAPIPETLQGEHKEIYPFLGSYLLAEAIDDAGADIVFHGHAHKGIEKGMTSGGIPVRNVAQPVIRHIYNIYTLNKEGVLGAQAAKPEQVAANPVF